MTDQFQAALISYDEVSLMYSFFVIAVTESPNVLISCYLIPF